MKRLKLYTHACSAVVTLHGFQNRPDSYTIEQGIWDVCIAAAAAQSERCGLTDTIYFKSNQVVTVAQGMMIASLIVTLIGLGFAIPGVRCWKEKPLWVICAIAGLLIFLSGALTIIPIAWYNHVVGNITSTFQENGLDIRVGYCIVLGYIGGIFEVLAGIVMIFGLCRCCKGWNRDERPIEEAVARAQRDRHQPKTYRIIMWIIPQLLFYT
uniref:Claudin 23.2 n=1 Tax=Nothobranchius furzeri TaxID=105023 RepID=A0A8C6LH74_NOTFU